MMSRSIPPDPVAGSSPSATEKNRIRSIAKKKFGVDTPPSEMSITIRSSGELRRTAARIPSPMPEITESTRAVVASSIVLGSRSPISVETG